MFCALKMASWLVQAASSSGRHSRWKTGTTDRTSESISTIKSWNMSSCAKAGGQEGCNAEKDSTTLRRRMLLYGAC